MGNAKRQAKNLAEKKAKFKAKKEVKSDLEIFRFETKKEDLDDILDDGFYALESDDGTKLFNGQFLPGSLIKAMYNAEDEKETK